MAHSAGDSATLTFTVTDGDTAIVMGSGDVPVLGTPRLVAWCEQATVAALADGLDEGTTTVGSRIRIDHLAPTPIGATVQVSATVAAVDGRQLTLEVEATDPNGRVAAGTISRVAVNRARFIERLAG